MVATRWKQLGWLILGTLAVGYGLYTSVLKTEAQVAMLTADTTPVDRIAADPSAYTGDRVNVTGWIGYATTLPEGLPDYSIHGRNASLLVAQCPNDAFAAQDEVLLTATVTNTTYNRTLSPAEVLERAETTNTTFDDTGSVTENAYTTVLDCTELKERITKEEREGGY